MINRPLSSRRGVCVPRNIGSSLPLPQDTGASVAIPVLPPPLQWSPHYSTSLHGQRETRYLSYPSLDECPAQMHNGGSGAEIACAAVAGTIHHLWSRFVRPTEQSETSPGTSVGQSGDAAEAATV